MPKEIKVMCPLGNGECPPTCKNHEAAKKLSEAIGDNFDPMQARLSVIFGDISHDVNVVDIANVMAKCTKEKEPSRIKPQR